MTWLLTIGTRLLGLRSVIGKAWGWIERCPWQAICIALMLCAAWEHHLVGKRDAQLARWPVIYAQERHSFQVERDSVNTLLAAIRIQNAAVQRMGEEGQRKQLAAASALRAAVARSAHGEVSAQRIDAERSEQPSQGKPCPSGKAVLDSRGDF